MKYMAAVIVLFAVVVMGRGAFVVLPAADAHARHAERMPVHPAQQRPDDAGPSGSDVALQIQDLQARMAASPSTRLILAQGKNAPATVAPVGVHQYRLSLVYYGKDYRRAVIDDAMLAEGDRLPSGGRVLAIHEDRVVVRDRTGRHTLAVPSARLRIGSIQTVAPAGRTEGVQP